VAPLLTSRQTFQERVLWICDAQLSVMRGGGVPEGCAVALLRTVVVYGIGFALAELALPAPVPGDADEIGRVRRMTGLLSPQASDELVRTALLVCDGCDMTTQFDIGIDLMIRGFDFYLRDLRPDPAAN